MKSYDNILTVSADLFKGSLPLEDEKDLFQIRFDVETTEDSTEIHVKSFYLLTGLKGRDEKELTVPMPKLAFDYAERLVWNSVKEDSEFWALHQHPDLASCGADY